MFAYCLGLFSEYETVMSEDRNGLHPELGHVYMVEVGLRNARTVRYRLVLRGLENYALDQPISQVGDYAKHLSISNLKPAQTGNDLVVSGH